RSANDVCSPGPHYPLASRGSRKQGPCEARAGPFKDPTRLSQGLVDGVDGRQVPGTDAWDSYVTNAPVLNSPPAKPSRDGRPRGCGGALTSNRKLAYKGRVLRASARAAQVDAGAGKALREGDQPQGYFACTLRIPDAGRQVRVALPGAHREDTPPRIIRATNRVRREVT